VYDLREVPFIDYGPPTLVEFKHQRERRVRDDDAGNVFIADQVSASV